MIEDMQDSIDQTKPRSVRKLAGKGRTAVAQARLILLVMINVAQLWVLAATVEAALAHRFSALLPLVICRYAYVDFLVASNLAALYQFRLPQAMKNPVESLLEDDHESLGQLLTELDGELAKHNFPRADALVVVTDGEADIEIAGEGFKVRQGETVTLPANLPHAVRAASKFKMLLIMIRA
jgi:quercetin dioxygenase-like cupin family protein